MGRHASLGLLLSVLGAGAPRAGALPQDLAPAFESGEVREISLRAPRGTLVSYYRLEVPAGPGYRPIGAVRWVVGPAVPEESTLPWPRPGHGGLQVETETTWLDASVRVHHVERSHAGGASLVWREIGEHTGRTLLLTGGAGRGFQSSEPVGRDLLRKRHGPLALPLHLVERVRAGLSVAPCQRLFLPLEHASAEVTARVLPVGAGRMLELLREDGGLAGRYCFEGEELVSFQTAEGGPRARRISRGEYQALVGAD